MRPLTERMQSADICENNHGGNLASVLAFERAQAGMLEMRARLLDLFNAHDNLTSKEIGEMLGIQDKNLFAPRLSDLKSEGILYETGQRRDHCNVLRLVDTL
jgi:hypothetical protein